MFYIHIYVLYKMYIHTTAHLYVMHVHIQLYSYSKHVHIYFFFLCRRNDSYKVQDACKLTVLHLQICPLILRHAVTKYPKIFAERFLFPFQKEENLGSTPLEVLRYSLNALKNYLAFVLMPRVVTYSGLEYFKGFLGLLSGRHVQTEGTSIWSVRCYSKAQEMKPASRSYSYQVTKHLGTHALRCFWHFQYHLIFQVQSDKNHWVSLVLDCLFLPSHIGQMAVLCLLCQSV